jgi:hypothetical protein
VPISGGRKLNSSDPIAVAIAWNNLRRAVASKRTNLQVVKLMKVSIMVASVVPGI